MRKRFDYDGALKELFQQGRPALLEHLTGGVPIVDFLNVELPKVQRRRVDLLLLLADGSMLHLEFQSRNSRSMAYRMAEYHILVTLQYGKPVRHVVLYVGKAGVRMAKRVDTGAMQFACEILDIRDIPVEEFIRNGTPADYALAILAGGAERRIPEILGGIVKLPAAERSLALARLAILCGLRPLSDKLRMELDAMPVIIEISKNAILLDIQNKALEQGRAEGEAKGEARGEARGEAKGRAEGVRSVLRGLLETKFGRLPKRAVTRLSQASAAELEKWAKKTLTARSLDDVLGPT